MKTFFLTIFSASLMSASVTMANDDRSNCQDAMRLLTERSIQNGKATQALATLREQGILPTGWKNEIEILSAKANSEDLIAVNVDWLQRKCFPSK